MTRESFLASVAVFILRLIFLTLRLRMSDPAGFTRNAIKGPILICFWHNRILGVALTFLRHYPHKERKGVTVLTSPSKDGEILAQIMHRFGMGAVRGSSSRRGSQALRELTRLIQGGADIAITPDGPRGPRYKLGPGVIQLAQTTGARILPVHAHFSRCLRMKTWDGFIVPLPFSTVSVSLDQLISLPAELTDEEFENARENLENLLKNEAD